MSKIPYLFLFCIFLLPFVFAGDINWASYSVPEAQVIYCYSPTNISDTTFNLDCYKLYSIPPYSRGIVEFTLYEGLTPVYSYWNIFLTNDFTHWYNKFGQYSSPNWMQPLLSNTTYTLKSKLYFNNAYCTGTCPAANTSYNAKYQGFYNELKGSADVVVHTTGTGYPVTKPVSTIGSANLTAVYDSGGFVKNLIQINGVFTLNDYVRAYPLFYYRVVGSQTWQVQRYSGTTITSSGAYSFTLDSTNVYHNISQNGDYEFYVSMYYEASDCSNPSNARCTTGIADSDTTRLQNVQFPIRNETQPFRHPIFIPVSPYYQGQMITNCVLPAPRTCNATSARLYGTDMRLSQANLTAIFHLTNMVTGVETTHTGTARVGLGDYYIDVTGLTANTYYRYSLCGNYTWNSTYYNTCSQSWSDFRTATVEPNVTVPVTLNTNSSSYWALNNNASDLYGVRNGTVTAATYDAGIVGNGLKFDGKQGYFNMTSFGVINSFTLSFWVYPISVDDGSGKYIILVYNFAGGLHTNIYAYQILQSGRQYLSVTVQGTERFPFYLDIGQWNHFVITKNDTDYVNVYKNGFEKYTFTDYGGVVTDNIDTTNAYAGSYKTASYNGNWLNGTIDEIGFWNRALSDNEITQLYHDGDACPVGSQCYQDSITYYPVVSLYNIDYTSATSAIVSGDLSYAGTSNLTYYFKWRNMTNLTAPAFGNWSSSDVQDVSDFTRKTYTVGSLTNATYYEVAFCVSMTGTEYCASQFTLTPGTTPYINTSGAINITAYTANLTGNLVSIGNLATIEVFNQIFINGSWSVLWSTNLTSAGSFYSFSPALDSGTSYIYQSCGRTAAGTIICGDEVSFATPVYDNPTITTSAASDISAFYANANSVLSTLGGYSSVKVYYRYKVVTLSDYQYTSNVTWTNIGSPTIRLEGLTKLSNYSVATCVLYGITSSCSYDVYFMTLDSSNIYINPSISTGTTDEFWGGLLGDYNTATVKTILGFIVIIGMILLAVYAFGKFGMQLGTFGIMAFMFLGVVLSTLVGLLPVAVLLLILIGGIVLIILKQMLFPGSAGGD